VVTFFSVASTYAGCSAKSVGLIVTVDVCFLFATFVAASFFDVLALVLCLAC
jgi:hypothetical protein